MAATMDESGLVPAPEQQPNTRMHPDGTLRYLSVHELLGRIVAEMPVVGKNSTAPSAIGGFKFRGIEAVKAALNPLLAKYGVFYVPDVLARTTEEKRGKEYATTLHVRFTWYGPAGDSVSGSVWAEGMDTRDKGHQKALTSAEKYWLTQSLSIPTEEQAGDDLDSADSPEPPHDDGQPRRRGAPPRDEPEPERASPSQVEGLIHRLLRVMDGEEYPEPWKNATSAARGPGRIETLTEMLDGERAPLTLAHLEGANALLTQIEDAARQAEPCGLCGSLRTNRVEVDGVWRCADPKGCEERQEKAAAGEPGPSDGPSGDAGDGGAPDPDGAASPAAATT